MEKNKSRKIIGTVFILMALLLAIEGVVAPGDPYPLNGFVKYTNGTGIMGTNITFNNQNTLETIYFTTLSGGYYMQDAANFPSGYQDGHIIQYYSIYGEYTNTTYHTINITQGSNTMNITLESGGTVDNASVTVEDGSISFGNLKLNDVKNTEGSDTQTIDTTGASGNQLIEIKLNSSTVTGINNLTTLTFVTGSPSLNQLLCQFKGGDAGSYTALTSTYQNYDDVMAKDSNANLNIQLTMPSSVTNDNYYDDYQFEIIVKATLL